MNFTTSFLTIALVSFLGALSPGPDFFIVVKNSLIGSRRAGFYTTFGVTSALIFHLTYTMIGLAVLLAEGSLLFSLIRYAGAGYLFYIGCKEFAGSFKRKEHLLANPNHLFLSNAAAFRQGFLTNLLNPKCALFFISLFSQFIAPNTPTSIKIGYASLNWSISLLWFLFLSFLITKDAVQKRIGPIQTQVERIMGIILMLISLKIIFF